MLIDIHTHSLSAKKSLQLIDGQHSVGIHPWTLVYPVDETLLEKQFQHLKTKFSSHVLAIGECGLDRRRKGIASLSAQVKVLDWHLDWALEVKRPIIIHCVKAYADLLGLLKKKHYKGKILLHDYRGSLTIARSLLNYDCFFSFGKSLFDMRLKQNEVFQYLALEKIFLETDDATNFSVEELYGKASSLLGIDQAHLEAIIEKNLVSFFADLDNISPSDVINNLGHTF